MTTQTTPKDELRAVIEASIKTMTDRDLKPRDWDVYMDEGELWANVWFAEEPAETLADRKDDAMSIIQSELSEQRTSLPVTVNANYQTDTNTDGIACWWSM